MPRSESVVTPPAVDVSLRDVLEADLPVFFRHQRDPVAGRMAALTPREHGAFMAHWATILASASGNEKTILAGARVAGYVVAYDSAGRREVGYWIGRSFWGRGVASRALALFLRQEAARPLFAVVAKHNPASIRVLEKCGFAVVGEGRSSAGGRGPVVDEVTLRLDGAPE